MMYKGIKFRIYPNKEQQDLINQTVGCCRYIYNKGLVMCKEAYEKGERVGYLQMAAMLTELKQSGDFTFLKVVDSIALQQSLRDLDRGFQNFFQKRTSYPVFKSKHAHYQSYRTININNNIRLVGKYIKLPKLGYIKIKQYMSVDNNINHVTVERTPTGKYFVVLNVEFKPQIRKNKGGCVGIDVGIKNYYSTSNGVVVSNPKYLEKSMHKLIREQRKLSKKQKGSNNYDKQRIKVSKIHEKIANQRNDFLQKQSTILLRENQTVCIEDLKVKQMMYNHKFAQHISSVSWSKFFHMLEYKALWYGNVIVKVPVTYPSSQLCSVCGYKNKMVKNLAIRKWECPECHSKHDRDINASINILNKGLQILSA